MIILQNKKIRVIAVCGPTASGKTALAVSLSKRFGGEIVSADSMQIYKGMDIATAKPDIAEQEGIPHHLLDYVDPSESYSVARFVNDANRAIADIVSRSKLPVIAGGTGLYIDSLLNGISFAEGEIDTKLRAELFDRLDRVGIDEMLTELNSFDPDSAERLKVERNPKRIVRAMEIYYSTGITMTEQNRLSRSADPMYDPTKIAIGFCDRERLYDRINRRVDIMLSKGLLDEARSFYSQTSGNTSVQAIGYKELKPYLDGERSLDESIEILKRSTRRYAKRQLTWFGRDELIKWFYADEYESYDELLFDVYSYLHEKGFEFI